MGALIQHLESIVARGGSDIDVIGAVEDELTGGDLLDAEVRSGPAALSEARERETQIQRGKRGAEALAAASRGGLYLPHEIPVLAAARPGDVAWPVRESVRFLCFGVGLRELTCRADDRALPAGDYASAVTELATRVSRVRIHKGRRA